MEVIRVVVQHQEQFSVWEQILVTVFGTAGVDGECVPQVLVDHQALKQKHEPFGRLTTFTVFLDRAYILIC